LLISKNHFYRQIASCCAKKEKLNSIRTNPTTLSLHTTFASQFTDKKKNKELHHNIQGFQNYSEFINQTQSTNPPSHILKRKNIEGTNKRNKNNPRSKQNKTNFNNIIILTRMSSHFLLLFLLLSSSSLLSICHCYQVHAIRLNEEKPVINSQTQQSTFIYNYNPAVIPHMDPITLLVRCQNWKNSSTPYDITPSVLALTSLSTPWNPDSIHFKTITSSSVIFKPESENENYGTEGSISSLFFSHFISDPRLTYSTKTKLYYLLYTAAQKYENGSVVARLSLATTPQIGKEWTRHGPLFQEAWSKSGAMLIRETPPHYLIYGDSTIYPGLELATSEDLIHWTRQDSLFMEVRKDHFDSVLVESGPMPLPLRFKICYLLF